uniref:Uncharacterized protein n=1 Tax=Mandrillus leucophaeus TaxID=9568 RepID=A0A2K5XH77_MANLE
MPVLPKRMRNMELCLNPYLSWGQGASGITDWNQGLSAACQFLSQKLHILEWVSRRCCGINQDTVVSWTAVCLPGEGPSRCSVSRAGHPFGSMVTALAPAAMGGRMLAQGTAHRLPLLHAFSMSMSGCSCGKRQSLRGPLQHCAMVLEVAGDSLRAQVVLIPGFMPGCMPGTAHVSPRGP